MNLSEDEIIQKEAKNCMHFTKHTLLPYEYEFTGIACAYSVIKRKNEFCKKHRKKR